MSCIHTGTDGFAVDESSSGTWRYTVPTCGTVSAATVTLRDVHSGTIVNSRDSQDAYDVNDFTWTGNVVTWRFDPPDTALIDRNYEARRELTLSWSTATAGGSVVVPYRVHRLPGITI